VRAAQHHAHRAPRGSSQIHSQTQRPHAIPPPPTPSIQPIHHPAIPPVPVPGPRPRLPRPAPAPARASRPAPAPRARAKGHPAPARDPLPAFRRPRPSERPRTVPWAPRTPCAPWPAVTLAPHHRANSLDATLVS